MTTDNAPGATIHPVTTKPTIKPERTADKLALARERRAQAAYEKARKVVLSQLRYLGYQKSAGAIYDRDGEQVADRPFSALSGCALIAIARGKAMWTPIEDVVEPEIESVPVRPDVIGTSTPERSAPDGCHYEGVSLWGTIQCSDWPGVTGWKWNIAHVARNRIRSWRV